VPARASWRYLAICRWRAQGARTIPINLTALNEQMALVRGPADVKPVIVFG